MTRKRKQRRNPSAQKIAHPADPNRRSQVVATRITPIEQQALMSAAVSAQMSLSDFLRQVALGRTVVARTPNRTPNVAPNLPKAFPPTYLPLLREINAIGVNLNQLTRVANASGYVPAALDPLLDDLNRLLDRLMHLERRA